MNQQNAAQVKGEKTKEKERLFKIAEILYRERFLTAGERLAFIRQVQKAWL